NGSETVERVRSWWRDRLYVVEGIVDDSAVSRPTVRLSFDIDDGTGFGGFVKRFDDPEVGECMLAVGFDRAIGEETVGEVIELLAHFFFCAECAVEVGASVAADGVEATLAVEGGPEFDLSLGARNFQL